MYNASPAVAALNAAALKVLSCPAAVAAPGHAGHVREPLLSLGYNAREHFRFRGVVVAQCCFSLSWAVLKFTWLAKKYRGVTVYI